MDIKFASHVYEVPRDNPAWQSALLASLDGIAAESWRQASGQLAGPVRPGESTVTSKG